MSGGDSAKIMKKVICISYVPLTLKIAEDFYLDYLFSDNANVEYWDMTRVYFENLQTAGSIDRPYIKRLATMQDIKRYLVEQNISNTVFIMTISYSIKYLNLFRLLSEYNCTVVFFARGYLPSPFRGTMLTRINNNIFNVRLGAIFKKLYVKIILNLYKSLGLVKNYDVVFAAGNVPRKLFQNQSKIAPINYYDYDNYLNIKNNHSRIIENKYCVYLDDRGPSQYDYKILNIKEIDYARLYNSLNTFFAIIEEKYGIPVVIAAHPKSDYSQNNVFDNRPIYKHQTSHLVKDCEFVITIMSTAIGYPVLYEKPILFIYTDEIKKLYADTDFPTIMHFANVLNCNACNIDSVLKKGDIFVREADIIRYAAYKYNYLASKESEDRLTRDIFREYIKNN